ncbi:MAG TPA: nicotinate-nucleotide adenylyltransferase [Methylocystis sp.]|nr:nicotinate-nucleotide adenylyltransferase [Methylocystis sp.]
MQPLPPIARLPPHPPGLRVGLFGGSFDPPHEGHLLVSEIALRRLRLDRLWWLVSPGNPLKDMSGRASLEARIEACRKLARHPRIVVSALEAEIGTRFTYDTLRYLHQRCPGVRFVWIMGADNLLGFHRWRHWREIAALAPIAVIDRPRATLKTQGAKAARSLALYRLPEHDAPRLAATPPPALVLLHDRRLAHSSTALRAGQRPAAAV